MSSLSLSPPGRPALPSLAELVDTPCAPLRGPAHRLDPASVASLLQLLPGWRLEDGTIVASLRFPDFAAALSAANHIGALAEAQNHHPDLTVGWGRLTVRFSTHDVGGLSENDFICAAKTSALTEQLP